MARESKIRFTVNLPLDVRLEMQDHPHINWSAIATKAFRIAIAASNATAAEVDRRLDDGSAGAE